MHPRVRTIFGKRHETMPHYKKIVGERCYLSPLSHEDADAHTRWENDLTVAIPLGDEAYTPTSLEKMHEQIDGALRNQSHVFSIVDLESELTIGRCMLFNLDAVNRSAMLGIMIGEKEYQNRGYGQEAMRLLLDYAFNLLNLNSVLLGVYVFNQQAIAAYRKVGFREIGIRRQARIIGRKKYDALFMDILAEEFEGSVIAALVEKS
jgi:RimJ/RimL family protein N-acetyltransferase